MSDEEQMRMLDVLAKLIDVVFDETESLFILSEFRDSVREEMRQRGLDLVVAL